MDPIVDLLMVRWVQACDRRDVAGRESTRTAKYREACGAADEALRAAIAVRGLQTGDDHGIAYETMVGVWMESRGLRRSGWTGLVYGGRAADILEQIHATEVA